MFRKMLQDGFADLRGWADDRLQDALEYFESVVKRKFNSSDDKCLIPVPGLPDNKDAGIRR
jgi:hypothetical protein